MGFVVVVLAVAGLGVRAEAAPGDLDLTFSGDGIAELNPSGSFDLAIDVAQQTDGKIVIAGRAGGSGGRVLVARYTSAGALDPTFSGDGKQFVDLTATDDAALSLVIHADGRIVVAGQANNVRAIGMARLNADGTPDNSFSGDGRAIFDLRAGNTFELVESLALTELGAYRMTGGLGRFAAVIGVTSNGTLDSTWSGDGLATVPFAGSSLGTSIDLGPGGTVTIGGTVTGTGAAADRTIIARFLVNGQPDPTFSGDGRNSVNVGNGYEDTTSIVVQLDGSVLAAGEANAKLSIVKWTSTGGLDPVFSGDGKQVIDLPGAQEWISDFGLDDSYLVLAGRMSGTGGRAFVARLDDSGALDAGFSGNGWMAVDRGPQNEWARSLVVDADGNYVAAGSSANDGKVLVFRVLGTDPP